MLQTSTVEESTFELLKRLMQDPFSYFDDIDFDVKIDLINDKPFDWKKIENRIIEMIKFENKIFDSSPY